MKTCISSLAVMLAMIRVGYGFEPVEVKIGSNVVDVEKSLTRAGIIKIDDPYEAIVIREEFEDLTFSVKTDKRHPSYYLTIIFLKKDMRVSRMILAPIPSGGRQNKNSQIDMPISRFTYESDRSLVIAINPPEIISDEEIEKKGRIH